MTDQPALRDDSLLGDLIEELDEAGRHNTARRLRYICRNLEWMHDERLGNRDPLVLRCVMDGRWGTLFGRFVEESDVRQPV